ncbi:hypothetical protein R5R35_004518 [Gryllus longicercus]|uniref:Tetratricopeptide repeat protein 21B n=1 Tax=Gryllus longicercus TaxID=2509291 RepID=A0AAN9W1J6_9ORTH
MRSEGREIIAKIFYCCREKYYHGMQCTALEGLKKFANDPVFQLYNGLSLTLSKRVQEGIRELDSLQNDQEVKLGAILALMFAHRQCATVDKEALLQLDSKLKEERKQANETNLYHATAVYLCTGRPDKAREYVDKLLKFNPESPDGLSLKGWVEISAGKDGKIQDAARLFDSAVKFSKQRNIDAMLGKSRFCELENDYEGAISILNQLIVAFPSLTLPLIEKMKNQLALLDWEQATETAQRILSIDSHSLEALKAKLLTTICRDGNYEDAALNIRRYFSEMEKMEPKNVELFLDSAQLFSRICGRNSLVLAETYRFAEKAAQLDPTNPGAITELGYQCLLQAKIKEATKYYRNATKLDDSSISALSGFTRCQLLDGGTRDQAIQQVEFLREVQGSQPTPELLMMSAQLVSNDADRALSYLNEAVDSHFRSLRAMPYGPKYLKNLDPDFLLQIVKEYLSHTPVQPSTGVNGNAFISGQLLPIPLKQSLTILEAVTKACPGLLEGLFQLARVQFLSGDLKAAVSTLQHILEDIDAAYANAHLLMAQIHTQQGNYQRAEQSLEVGLSYNFKVRDHPLYHFITALVHKKQGHMDECIQSLKTAMTLCGFKTNNDSSRTDGFISQELSLPDKVSLFLELAEVYQEVNSINEASKVMQDALELFSGTSEEGRITVANADLALHRGDAKLALDILQTVKPNHPYYQQAHCKMADIHLHFRKDRRAFAECFRELVENAPGPQSYVMLGDAYMSIQEPDRAIDAYEQALKRNPRDSILACKMGKALIKTHQYGKAINYYKEAVKGDDNSDLKLDMSELYMKLGQYDKAEKVLMQELDSKTDFSDVQILIGRTKVLLLLAKVREKSGNTHAALDTLQEAHNNQNRVLKRISVDDKSEVQKQVAANICQQMADHASTLRDYDSAIHHYKEALVYKSTDKPILVALAKLYMQVNDLEQCQMTCMTLLKTDADNEAASIMMADLAFRRVDFETAAFHFQQLLSRRPDYWTALARLVEVMRRTGNLNDVPPYLSRAQVVCARSTYEAGLAYCEGLFEWYSGNTNEALRQFNNARRDQEWGQQAIYNMIEICLNPDDETLGSEAFPDTDDEFMRDSREMALRTAERLLKELRPRPGGGGDEAFNHRLLANFWLLATRQKPNVERALQDFTTLATMDTYRDHVGITLGLATAYMMLKQTPRARNQLKRVAKNNWNFEDAEYLERCWLLLADIYIQNGKYDMASELLKRVLQHNKGCTKAYEYAGFVAEKDQSYREAACQYERAWKFGGCSNPAIGYKLAFNYMKGKRHADAIDVCQQVLHVQPDYPRIRKEILDKCRNNIRT